MAAYAGAGLAEADPMRTGFTAFRIGIAAYIMPFIFVFNPALILLGQPTELLIAVPSALIGAIALAGASTGWLLIETNYIEKLVLGISAILLIKPGVVTDLIGVVLLLIVLASQRRKQAVLKDYGLGRSQ